MKNPAVILFLLFSVYADAQYYYKDVIGTRETNEIMQRLTKAGIRSTSLSSFEPDGSLTEGFFVQQTITKNPLALKTISRSGTGEEVITSFLTSYFNEQIRLVRSVDSSGSLINIATYEYNDKGHLVKTLSQSRDSAGAVVAEEIHEWIYSEPGRVQKMIRRKNGVMMDEILFESDSQGNVIEEWVVKNGVSSNRVFYYYNDDNRLTDIVRFNDRLKKLLPDYLFEYSPQGDVIQKITVPANSIDYLIWRYQYDERGLKIREACFNKYKELLGRVHYEYQSGQ